MKNLKNIILRTTLLTVWFLCVLILLTECTNPNDIEPNDNLQSDSSSCYCSSLPSPLCNSVTVNSVDEIISEINNATGSLTIFLEKGTYSVSNSKFIYVNKDNICIRSKSGNCGDAIIKGQGMNASEGHHGFLISGKNVTIADLTIRDIRTHGIQVMGEKDADNCLIHNVHFIDINEQMVKVSKTNTQTIFCDNGIVECCTFEFTKDAANQYYTGGVDGLHCNKWIVRNSTFKNIKSPESQLTEPAIHFWGMSKNITAENNLIVNCDRGIMFGMGSDPRYGSGGLICNNRIHTSTDVGISLEQASDVKIYNNTVDTPNYGNSIEIRFSAATGNLVKNNLTNKNIKIRDGGQAQIESNVIFTQSETDNFFEDYSKHNYKLKASANKAIDKGTTLSEAKYDFECDFRPKGNAYDVGADEY